MIRDKHGQSEIKQYYLDHAEQILVQEWKPMTEKDGLAISERDFPWFRVPRFGEINRLPH